jgi:hypothetical protein
MHAGAACAWVWWKTLKDRDHVEALGLDGNRLLKQKRNVMNVCGLGLLDPGSGAVVKTLTNHRVPSTAGHFFVI